MIEAEIAEARGLSTGSCWPRGPSPGAGNPASCRLRRPASSRPSNWAAWTFRRVSSSLMSLRSARMRGFLRQALRFDGDAAEQIGQPFVEAGLESRERPAREVPRMRTPASRMAAARAFSSAASSLPSRSRKAFNASMASSRAETSNCSAGFAPVLCRRPRGTCRAGSSAAFRSGSAAKAQLAGGLAEGRQIGLQQAAFRARRRPAASG